MYKTWYTSESPILLIVIFQVQYCLQVKATLRARVNLEVLRVRIMTPLRVACSRYLIVLEDEMVHMSWSIF